MLDISDLECVRGNRIVFRNVSFVVRPGGCLRLTGPNGSGKTSLLRMLCGLLPPSRGTICWNGAGIHTLEEEYFSIMTYIGHRNGVKDELTAQENLRVSSGLNGIEISRQTAAAALDRMGLAGRIELPARFLSEGQKRRVALARLLVCRTSLWLLDEVLTSLDPAAVNLVQMMMEEHLSAGGMAVVATHQEMDLLQGRSQRIELAA